MKRMQWFVGNLRGMKILVLTLAAAFCLSSMSGCILKKKHPDETKTVKTGRIK